MGWQIDLFRVRPGQDPCTVRDVQYDWEEHDGYTVVDGASAETDAWIKRAMELLESVSPGFKLVEENGEWSLRFDDHGHTEHVRIWQPDGPLISDLYSDGCNLRVNLGHAEAHEGEYFEQLWIACKVLAERAECAVFPQYDDDPVDTTLTLDEARDAYGDWA